MKTQTQFKNASLVSVVNGTIVVKDSTGREHPFTNASIVSVNNGTIIIETEWEPKEGELIKIHTKEYGVKYGIFYYSTKADIWIYGTSIQTLKEFPIDTKSRLFPKCAIEYLSPVTVEEQKEFDDFCKSQGKIWNKETLQWEKYKWKPKDGECYFTLTISLGNLEIVRYVWNDDLLDTNIYKVGNCFKTKKEAEAKLEQIKKLLLEV